MGGPDGRASRPFGTNHRATSPSGRAGGGPATSPPAADGGAAAAAPSPPDQRDRVAVAMLVLVALAVAVFARGMRGVAVDVTVVDDAVVGWLAGVDLPGFQALMRALSFLSSWWVLNGVLYALIIALLVLRRFRHLIIWLILTNLLALVGASILGPVAQRPRPFGGGDPGRLGRLGHAAAARHLTRRSTTALASSASCGTPGWPTATSSRPTCWSARAACCSSTSPSSRPAPAPGGRPSTWPT